MKIQLRQYTYQKKQEEMLNKAEYNTKIYVLRLKNEPISLYFTELYQPPKSAT